VRPNDYVDQLMRTGKAGQIWFTEGPLKSEYPTKEDLQVPLLGDGAADIGRLNFPGVNSSRFYKAPLVPPVVLSSPKCAPAVNPVTPTRGGASELAQCPLPSIEAGPSAQAPPQRSLDRLREAIRVRHYSIRTEDAYGDWARRFIRFHGRRHPQLGLAAGVSQPAALDRPAHRCAAAPLSERGLGAEGSGRSSPTC
jgi:hypothetical protein